MPRSKIQLSKFYLALVSFTLGHILFLSIMVEMGIGLEATAIVVVFATFFYLFYKGFNWSRWVLMVLLLLMSVTCISDGIELDEIIYLLAGAGHLISLLFAFLSGRVKRQDPLPVIDMEADDVEDDSEDPTPVNTGNFIQAGINYDYPPLVTRYKAVLIDLILLFAILVTTMVVLGDSEYRSPVMITLGLLAGFVYDPVLTAYSATIGQRLMKIRVRRFSNPTKKVGIVSAYVRAIVKWPLGWLSFITINFNSEHRAIHDFAGGSVVVRSENQG
jgi:uncharacterized RDD family membrane protein YckC